MSGIILPNGTEYQFAPLGFTDEACELLELSEQIDSGNIPVSRFLRVTRNCMVQSLRDGGASQEQIDEALASIKLSAKSMELLSLITESMLDFDAGK